MSVVALEIYGGFIRSTDSQHSAEFDRDADGWRLSWLPGRLLDRDQATSGMQLADTVAGGLAVGDSRWPALDTWARELGLSGPEAVVRASTTDEIRERIARAEAAEASPHLYGVTDDDEKMALHAEDEAIDLAQLDAVEQGRQIADLYVYDVNREAADAHAAGRQRCQDAPVTDVGDAESFLEKVKRDALPMTGPVEESEAGEVWSRRVDAAVHGFDATSPDTLDIWMRAHAASSEPHLHEAGLVASWESIPKSGPAWDAFLEMHGHDAAAVDTAAHDAAAVRD